MNITDLGFALGNESNKNNFEIGRVITVNKESYIISDGKSEKFAKLTGNLIYGSSLAEDFPTVGDFVLFQNFEDNSLAIIHNVLERRNLLKRKSAGKKVEFQLIGANIDYAIIIQALDNDFNLNRLERYLAMVREFNVRPILLFSKSDLRSENECKSIVEQVKNLEPDEKVISFSNLDLKSIEQIKEFLIPKKTYCIIGSSGVGKTTLINNLIGEQKYATREVRKGDNKGKHATTSRQLMVLENGSMLIDTPGMRELANISVSEGIEKTFDKIVERGNNCKFNDCTHTVEKGCSVLEALKKGKIDKREYDNFIKLRKESEYYERSYLEKRKRDKEFGKMIKRVLKNRTRKRY